MSKKLNKYIATLNYFNKILIVLSATSGRISIIYFTSVIGAPAWMEGVRFSLVLSLTTEIIKKLLSITRTKKKKYNKIVMLAKSKLNIIETLVSQAFIDLKISHKELLMKKESMKNWKKIFEWWKVMMN